MKPDQLTHSEFRRVLPRAQQKRGGIRAVFHFPGVLRERSNFAAVVMNDGALYLGEARCSPRDTWNRRRGFRIAVGRALAEAASDSPSFGCFALVALGDDPLELRRELSDLLAHRHDEVIGFLDAAAEERRSRTTGTGE